MRVNFPFFSKVVFSSQHENIIQIRRFHQNPIITPEMSTTLGDNINGPSLIRVPEWLSDPLGKYYLYFAHHEGKYIRLAYADKLEGPWKIYEPGTLKLEETVCVKHIASPDLHIDNEKQELRMYFHGPVPERKKQASFVATSGDGIHFKTSPEILGDSYFRVFRWQDYYYAIARLGIVYRSKYGLTQFEAGPNPFNTIFSKSRVRHLAVQVNGDILYVFYSRIGDNPESILMSTINLAVNWMKWKASKPVIIMKPEMDYEGANLPLIPSGNGIASQPVRQLRDPALFSEEDKTFLLYSVAGENGIALAEVKGYINHTMA